MRRLASFFRPILPADPWQLVFLLGVVCLTLCPRLAWRPDTSAIQLVFAIYPIIFAGLAGYFICFWPGPRPVRRMLFTVVMPSFVALAGIFLMVALSSPARTSVLQMNSHRAADALNAIRFFMKYSVGLHFSLFGFLLIVTFAVRMSLGASHLPLTLPGSQTGDEDDLWRRTKILAYLMIGPMFLVQFIFELPTFFAFAANIHLPFPTVWVLFSDLAGTILILCVALWVIKAAGRKVISGVLRAPDRNFLLLAVGCASAVAAAIPVAMYLYDRAHWAAFDYGKHSPPELNNYFFRPHLWVISFIAGAAIEEVIFRGFVQPKMIERYGIMQGMFLTGIAWAATHFRGDPYPHSDLGVVLHLILRVAMCVALSFVFGWLTVKSGSILPAMVAHAAINFFADSAAAFPQLPGESAWAITIILWAILAYLLFRYWPPESQSKTLPVNDEGEAAPAI